MTVIVTPGTYRPDMDGAACSMAYCELLGRDCFWHLFEGIQTEPMLLMKRLGIRNPDLRRFDKVILVDASSTFDMDAVIKPENVIEVIDHRRVELSAVSRQFPHAKLQIEQVGAAATLIVERFMANGKLPSMNAGQMLYCAIFSNTLGLQTKNTTSRDITAVKWLEKKLKLDRKLIDWLFKEKTKVLLADVYSSIDSDFKWKEINGLRIGISQLELFSAKDVLKNTDMIERRLLELKKKHKLDIVFLNMPEILTRKNYFITSDMMVKEQLRSCFGAKFSGNVGNVNGLFLRKEVSGALFGEGI